MIKIGDCSNIASEELARFDSDARGYFHALLTSLVFKKFNAFCLIIVVKLTHYAHNFSVTIKTCVPRVSQCFVN